MENSPKAVLLKFPGTNCDEETARALFSVGFESSIVPFASLTADHIHAARLVVLPGGFSYGDYIMAGRFAQLEIERCLGRTLADFAAGGGHVLGICNGFQILLKLGLLPTGSLVENVGRRFVCRWTRLKKTLARSPYLSLLPAEFELPVAHGEGRFVTLPGRASSYIASGLAPLIYGDDINGSEESIAALQDESGRVLGLMPHPERFLYRDDYYAAELRADSPWGWGYYFFKSIYESVARPAKSDRPSSRALRASIGSRYR